MSGYLVCSLVLLLALLPAGVVASRGGAVDRLVGLEIASGISVVFMLVLAQVSHQSYFLSVPLVLVPMSFAGTLVFTRLLGRRED